MIMKRLLTLLSSIVLLFLSGCWDSEVEWLPDSSGFVYIKEDGTLAHYDVARQAWRVITKIDANGEGKPAVSLDGKQIAVCRQITSGTNESIELLVYSLGGTLLHRAGPFGLTTNEGVRQLKAGNRFGRCYWSPDGSRLCMEVQAPAPANGGRPAGGETGTSNRIPFPTLSWYDLGQQTFHEQKGVCLAMDLNCWDYSPYIPDGRGLLVVQPVRTDAGYLHIPETQSAVIVNWQGEITELQHPPARTASSGTNHRPEFLKSEWVGNILQLGGNDKTLVVDLPARRIHVQRQPATSLPDAQKLSHVAPMDEDTFAFSRSYQRGSTSHFRLGLLRAIGLRATGNVAVELADVSDVLNARVSPDRKHIVVHAIREGRTVLLVTSTDQHHVNEVPFD